MSLCSHTNLSPGRLLTMESLCSQTKPLLLSSPPPICFVLFICKSRKTSLIIFVFSRPWAALSRSIVFVIVSNTNQQQQPGLQQGQESLQGCCERPAEAVQHEYPAVFVTSPSMRHRLVFTGPHRQDVGKACKYHGFCGSRVYFCSQSWLLPV